MHADTKDSTFIITLGVKISLLYNVIVKVIQVNRTDITGKMPITNS